MSQPFPSSGDLYGSGPYPVFSSTAAYAPHQAPQDSPGPPLSSAASYAPTPSAPARAVRPGGPETYVGEQARWQGDANAQWRQGDRARPSSFFGVDRPAEGVGLNGSPSLGPPLLDAPRPTSVFDPAALLAQHNQQQHGMAQAQSPPPSFGMGGSPTSSQHHSPRQATPSENNLSPTGAGPLLDHSHLRPGKQAALLSHAKTIELYRENAKKTNDPDLIYEFAVFMIEASKSMDPLGEGDTEKAQGQKDDLAKEATTLLKKIADRGHPDAQYFLADCCANGIGTPKGKQDFDKAYQLFALSAKHGHPDAAYRAATCYEKGWGCRRDSAKAVQFYRKAASANHPGAMYRLGTAELNGELSLSRKPREGVKWLKRSAEAATAEFPHALHELALIHEKGINNVVFVDPEYACELLAQAAELGYAPSAYKLGVNYEFGRMGCPQDGGLSIHMYNIAAQQNHKEACFALTAWYLVGAPGILPQSDTEAYLWAKKAAEQGLAKAEYAVGIGTVKDMREAKEWYKKAAEHGDKRATQRLKNFNRPFGAMPPPPGPASPSGQGAGRPPRAGMQNPNDRPPPGEAEKRRMFEEERKLRKGGGRESKEGKDGKEDCVVM